MNVTFLLTLKCRRLQRRAEVQEQGTAIDTELDTRNGRRCLTVWRGETTTEREEQQTKHAKWMVESKLTHTLEDWDTAMNGTESEGNKEVL